MPTKTKTAQAQGDFEGHCMKCKAKRPFTSTIINTMKNGAKMAKGPCGVCGTTIAKILKKTEVPQ